MIQEFIRKKLSQMNKKSKLTFSQGIKDGLPIALGYLPVSFGFGLMAVQLGINPLHVILISITNLTSAGQVAGVGVIAAMGTLAEMALTQFIINIRYSLMSISLSQKLEPSFKMIERFIVSFGITDEIFAVAASKPHLINAKYMYGLILTPFFGWSSGTIIGSLCGAILPEIIKNALGITIYGMFLAIVIPPSKTSRGIFVVAVLAAVISCILRYTPILNTISPGFAIIICAVIASLAGAILFPVQDLDNEEVAE